MKRIKKLISLMLTFSLMIGLWQMIPYTTSIAATTSYTSGDFTYTVGESSTATITAYSGSDEQVVIPEKLDGNIVTGIGDNAFKGCVVLKQVSMPNTVTSIGNEAFAGSSLTDIVLPPQLQSIGYCFISGVEGIIKITLPNSVQTMKASGMGDGPFTGSYVKEAVFEDGRETIPANVFRRCSTLEKIEMPETVTTIGDRAFDGCKSLTEIVIPEKVTNIGNEAFAGSSLTDIVLPPQLQSIGYCFISGVEGIIKITLPNSVQTMKTSGMGDGPFTGSYVKEAVFEDGRETIPANVFRRCSTLEKIEMPETVTTIGDRAFDGCKSLTEIVIPEKVTNIGNEAFAGSSLTDIVLPPQLQSIGYCFISGVEGIIKITLPNSVQTMKTSGMGDGPFTGSYVKEAVFEDGRETIPANVFRRCSTLEKIEMPETVTTIGDRAFDGCKSLTEIVIPEKVTNIGNEAFAGSSLTDIVLPPQLQSIGYCFISGVEGIIKITLPNSVQTMKTSGMGDGPFTGSYVKEAVFEDGRETIPANVFRRCSTLEKIEMPETVTSIGDRAFNDCKSLISIRLGNNITLIGKDVLTGCDSVTAYCNYFSNSVISCIDSSVKFAPSDDKFEDSEDKVIDRTTSMFYANTNALSSGGTLSFTVKFQTKKKWENELSGSNIVTYIPKGTELVESSIKLNGEMVTKYTYNTTTRRLSIPINTDLCQISYSVKVSSKEKIVSYAYISTKKSGVQTTEVIGTINEEFTGITINACDVVGNQEVIVSGIAPNSGNVDLYVDGKKQGSVTALKNGAYSTMIKIEDAKDYYPYTLMAKSIDEYGNDLSATKTVTYESKAPILDFLELDYYDSNRLKKVDLLNSNGVAPRVYYAPKKEFTFVVGFQNMDKVESVYVTSTRNNEKKSMTATYDSSLGKYVASGFFDPENKSYVPGIIGVEYKEKNQDIIVSDSFDITPYQTIMSESSEDAKVEYITQTEDEVEAVVDWSTALQSFEKAEVKAHIKYIDTTSGTSLEDIKDFAGITEKAIDYLVPGANDEKYILNMDYSNPDNIVMLIYDVADSGLTIADKAISMKLDLTDFGKDLDKYVALEEWKSNIGYASKTVGFAYKTYGIYSDYDDLITEINQSSTITDKAFARDKALELRQNQMAFLAMTTVLPMLVAGSTMAGPLLVFSGLLAAMSATSNIFYDARVAQIKGQPFKLNWVIDPSGYIYNKTTNERLENVTVSAYWIPYDDTDDFWSRVPEDSSYGVLWDALEYEQENPMLSNVDGKYAWDVPEGWWRVKCEKEGYQTAWSDWMTVPPVQVDINIGMTANNNIDSEEPITEVPSTTELATEDIVSPTTEEPIVTPKVKLNATKIPLQIGKSTTALKLVSKTPSNDKVAKWTTSNKKIATVSKKGKIKAIKKGKATITVTMKSGAKAKCTVVVQRGKVTTKNLTLNKKKLTLKKGKTAKLIVARNPITATEKLTWSTSNKRIATVDKNGKVKAKKKGKVTITVKSKNGKKARCVVTIK